MVISIPAIYRVYLIILRSLLLRKGFKIFLSILFITLAHFSAGAQQRDSTTPPPAVPTDTLKKDLVTRLQEMSRKEGEKSLQDFQKEKDQLRQEQLVDQVIKTTQKAKVYLKHGIDTIGINNELKEINSLAHAAGDGVFYNKGTTQTSRNLVTTSKIFVELLNRVNIRKTQLDIYEANLSRFRYISDSLNADSSLYNLPDDSLALVEYLQKWMYVARGLAPVDSALTAAISHIHILQATVNYQAYDLNASLEELEVYQKELSHNFFNREVAGLLGHIAYKRPINEILHVSRMKGQLALSFYAEHHMGKIFLLLLFIIASTLFIRSLKAMLRKENLVRDDLAGQLLLRYPVLSAIVIVISLFQFIFPDPPFIFNVLLWIFPTLALTIIFYKFISRYWIRFWILMLVLCLVASLDNLVLQASRQERWVMLALALFGVICGCYFIFGKHKKELREKLILAFIALTMLFETASVIANLMGRFNLAKSMFISGYSNVIIGILFIWTVRLINEGLTLASSIYTKQDRKLFYVNFERVGDKAPPMLYTLLVVGWFILLGRNFYEYKMISEPLRNFFLSDRKIGDYTFTINNILIFFGIMLLATVISKVISFFASDKRPPHNSTSSQRKAGLGSWLLLIRVSIISVGLFLALAASGFPLDRITILLGALGVGVGLGLQGLVNNLVSGLIIAFEKPVNVGDIVEISGQVGTMKSIGFRSSVVSASNGADVVIPNGDLLNAHLINWTLGGNRRQIEIPLQVAYGTDLDNLQKILLELLGKEERVIKFPMPVVQLQGFGNSAIDAKVLFWVNDYREAARVKTTIIAGIDIAFRKNNITIPFPQQEVYIHNETKENDDKANPAAEEKK
jgi:potassium efflux system protein